MSRCQSQGRHIPRPCACRPGLTATAVSLTTLRKGTHPCDLPLVPFDVAARARTQGPVVAQAAGELRQQRVFLIAS